MSFFLKSYDASVLVLSCVVFVLSCNTRHFGAESSAQGVYQSSQKERKSGLRLAFSAMEPTEDVPFPSFAFQLCPQRVSGAHTGLRDSRSISIQSQSQGCKEVFEARFEHASFTVPGRFYLVTFANLMTVIRNTFLNPTIVDDARQVAHDKSYQPVAPVGDLLNIGIVSQIGRMAVRCNAQDNIWALVVLPQLFKDSLRSHFKESLTSSAVKGLHTAYKNKKISFTSCKLHNNSEQPMMQRLFTLFPDIANITADQIDRNMLEDDQKLKQELIDGIHFTGTAAQRPSNETIPIQSEKIEAIVHAVPEPLKHTVSGALQNFKGLDILFNIRGDDREISNLPDLLNDIGRIFGWQITEEARALLAL